MEQSLVQQFNEELNKSEVLEQALQLQALQNVIAGKKNMILSQLGQGAVDAINPYQVPIAYGGLEVSPIDPNKREKRLQKPSIYNYGVARKFNDEQEIPYKGEEDDPLLREELNRRVSERMAEKQAASEFGPYYISGLSAGRGLLGTKSRGYNRDWNRGVEAIEQQTGRKFDSNSSEDMRDLNNWMLMNSRHLGSVSFGLNTNQKPVAPQAVATTDDEQENTSTPTGLNIMPKKDNTPATGTSATGKGSSGGKGSGSKPIGTQEKTENQEGTEQGTQTPVAGDQTASSSAQQEPEGIDYSLYEVDPTWWTQWRSYDEWEKAHDENQRFRRSDEFDPEKDFVVDFPNYWTYRDDNSPNFLVNSYISDLEQERKRIKKAYGNNRIVIAGKEYNYTDDDINYAKAEFIPLHDEKRIKNKNYDTKNLESGKEYLIRHADSRKYVYMNPEGGKEGFYTLDRAGNMTYVGNPNAIKIAQGNLYSNSYDDPKRGFVGQYKQLKPVKYNYDVYQDRRVFEDANKAREFLMNNPSRKYVVYVDPETGQRTYVKLVEDKLDQYGLKTYRIQAVPYDEVKEYKTKYKL